MIHSTVDALVTKQANASGSLILFVIPCNQVFAPAWAEEYKLVLFDAASKFNGYTQNAVNSMLCSEQLPSSCKGVLEHILITEVEDMMRELRDEAEKCIVRYNKLPLVFTTNDHYLEETFHAFGQM